MSEEHTRNMPDSRSFEERVFARFDAVDSRLYAIDGRLNAIDGRLNAIDGRLDAIDGRLDAIDGRLDAVDGRLDAVDGRLDAVDTRLQKLEIESERRSLETKPIWERALAQIEELRQAFGDFREEVHEAFRDISRKFGVLGNDMMQLRADQAHVETRLDKLESKPQH